jgi:hypothetical protein
VVGCAPLTAAPVVESCAGRETVCGLSGMLTSPQYSTQMVLRAHPSEKHI